jgi:hypothetical protein
VLAADPKVVQRVLGHAAAAMTMDLYGTWWTTTCGRLPRWSGGTSGHLADRRDGQDGGQAGAS